MFKRFWINTAVAALCGMGVILVVAQENIVVRNVPAIDADVAESISKYKNVRAASVVDWIGDKLLIRTRFGESSQLHLVSNPMGMRKQITFQDQPISGVLVPNVEQPDFFLYLMDADGTESYQIYRYELKTGESTMISSGTGRYTGVSHDPTHSKIAYTSTKRTDQYSDIYIQDLTDGSVVELHLIDDVGWSVLSWHPEDDRVLLRKYISVAESHLFEMDLESKEMTRLLEPYGKISLVNANYIADGSIILITDHDSDFRRIHRINPETQQLEMLIESDQWDISSYTLSKDRTQMVYSENANGYTVLHLGVAGEAQSSPILQEFSHGMIGSRRFNMAGTKLAFTYQSTKYQSDVYVLDLETEEVTQWTQSETGGLRSEDLVEAELIEFQSFDDLTIPAFMYVPEVEGPHPVLIYIHGGPASQYRPSFSSRFQYYVNELNLAVIAPNVRGSNGYGKQYLTLDDWEKREDSVRDIGALLDWIETQPNLDSNRVIVDGGSYGGYMVLASLVHYSERLLAGSERVGISNFVTFLENTQGYRRDLRRVEYGDERIPEMREFLESIAPSNQVDKITRPLLVVQGQNDPRVPASESEQIVKALEGQDVPVWYVLYLDEGHGVRKKSNQDHSFEVQVQFLRTVLRESIEVGG